MADWITDHHELCDGTECNRWDCAALPGNVGQWREGSVAAVNPDGSVVIEWSDGTRSTMPKLKTPARATWEESVRKDGGCKDPMCACQQIARPEELK